MKVRVAEFYAEATGTHPRTGHTRTKVDALHRWGIPTEVAGNGTGLRVHHTVDLAHLGKAREAYLLEMSRLAAEREARGHPPETVSTDNNEESGNNAITDLIGSVALLHRKMDVLLRAFDITIPE